MIAWEGEGKCLISHRPGEDVAVFIGDVIFTDPRKDYPTETLIANIALAIQAGQKVTDATAESYYTRKW